MACSGATSSASSCSPLRATSDDTPSTASLWSVRRQKAKAARNAASDHVSARLLHIEEMMEQILCGLSLLLDCTKCGEGGRNRAAPPGLAAPNADFFDIFDSRVKSATQTSAWEPLPEMFDIFDVGRDVAVQTISNDYVLPRDGGALDRHRGHGESADNPDRYTNSGSFHCKGVMSASFREGQDVRALVNVRALIDGNDRTCTILPGEIFKFLGFEDDKAKLEYIVAENSVCAMTIARDEVSSFEHVTHVDRLPLK